MMPGPRLGQLADCGASWFAIERSNMQAAKKGRRVTMLHRLAHASALQGSPLAAASPDLTHALQWLSTARTGCAC